MRRRRTHRSILVVAGFFAACATDREGPREGAREGTLASGVVAAHRLHEEGCARKRAICDADKARCEHANTTRVRERREALLVPCDLDHDLCLGHCRPGHSLP